MKRSRRHDYLLAMDIQPWYRRDVAREAAPAVAAFPGCLLFYREEEDERRRRLLMNLGVAIQRALGRGEVETAPHFPALAELAADGPAEDCRIALYCGAEVAERAAEQFQSSLAEVRTSDLSELMRQPEAKAALWRELQQTIQSLPAELSPD